MEICCKQFFEYLLCYFTDLRQVCCLSERLLSQRTSWTVTVQFFTVYTKLAEMALLASMDLTN